MNAGVRSRRRGSSSTRVSRNCVSPSNDNNDASQQRQCKPHADTLASLPIALPRLPWPCCVAAHVDRAPC